MPTTNFTLPPGSSTSTPGAWVEIEGDGNDFLAQTVEPNRRVHVTFAASAPGAGAAYFELPRNLGAIRRIGSDKAYARVLGKKATTVVVAK